MLDLIALIDIKPGPNVINWPFPIGWYGLGYAVAITVGAWVAQREIRRRGFDPRVVIDGLLLTVVLGLIGARLYHVIDQWDAIYSHDPLKIILPPYSGLGIYGGVAGGILGIAIFLRRRRIPVLPFLDVAAVAFLIGQAIARWGNFFNQELYGTPTDAPWGIAIDCAHRVQQYTCDRFPEATTGFHPLFFYESAITLTGALLGLYLFRRFSHRLRDGDLFAMWFIWYGTARGLLETFREGYNWTLAGIPVAMLIGGLAVLFGVGFLVWNHRRPGRSRAELIAEAQAARTTAASSDATMTEGEQQEDEVDRPTASTTSADARRA